MSSARDHVLAELVQILAADTWFEFKPLFLLVNGSLRDRKAVRAGEEMLRLRVYEKLQHLAEHGFVERDSARYRGIPDQLAALREYIEKREQHILGPIRETCGAAFGADSKGGLFPS